MNTWTAQDALTEGVRLLPIIKAVCAPFPQPESRRILLFCTAAVENDFKSGAQVGGPAHGVCQQEMASICDGRSMSDRGISPALTAIGYDHWNNDSNADFAAFLDTADGAGCSLLGAALHYRRAPGPLPAPWDYEGMWGYYKRYYNSEMGATLRHTWDEKIAGLVVPVLAQVAFS